VNFWDVVWIVVGGALIGYLAKLFMPGKQNIPWWATVLAGIAGMLVGDWLARLFGVEVTSGFDWIRHGLQILVAIVAVAVVGGIMGRRSPQP